MDEDNFDHFDTVRCKVTATDGKGGSDVAFSNGVLISNTPAVFTSLTISPKPASPDDLLTCTPVVFDADDDSLTFNFKWQVNFGPKLLTGNTLPADNFGSQDIVECLAWAEDGFDESEPAFDEVIID